MKARSQLLVRGVVCLALVPGVPPTRAQGAGEQPVEVASRQAAAPPPRADITAPACTVDTTPSGNPLTTTVGFDRRGRRYQLQTTVEGPLGGPWRSSFVLSAGVSTWMRGQATGSLAGFTATFDFDRGARGARHLELSSADGLTATGAIDGRALARFTIGGNTPPVFVDGKSTRPLKLKGPVRRVLRELFTCAGQTPPGLARGRSLSSSCDTCNIGCGLKFLGCGLGVLASAAAGVGLPFLALNVANCEEALLKCTTVCAQGTACCPVPCAGGHGVSLGSNSCAATCSDDAVCCGGPNSPQGQCCGGTGGNGSFCCGGQCLDAGARCLNPNTGTYCANGATGEVCADASPPGAVFCCDASAPVCRDTTAHLCCASNAGEVCDINGLPGCCPPSTPFCSQGNAGGCCAEPVCCDPPTSKCGSACCNPFTQVCGDAGQSLCVGAPADVVIDEPAPSAQVPEDTLVTLAGHVFGGTCTNQNGGWTSNVQADQVPVAGCSVVAKLYGLGAHTLTLTVSNNGSAPGSASVAVTVIAKPAITAKILLPTTSTAINVDNCDDVELESTATGAPPLAPFAWTWQADQQGCAPFTIPVSCPFANIICSIQPPPDTYITFWHSCGPPFPPCTGAGKIKLQVTDALSQTAGDVKAVTLVRNPN